MILYIFYIVCTFASVFHLVASDTSGIFVGGQSSVVLLNQNYEHVLTVLSEKFLFNSQSIALDSENNILYVMNYYDADGNSGSLLIVDLDDIDFDNIMESVTVIQDDPDALYFHYARQIYLHPTYPLLVIVQDTASAITLLDLNDLNQENLSDKATFISNPEVGQYFNDIRQIIFSSDGFRFYVVNGSGGSILQVGFNEHYCGFITIFDFLGQSISVLDNSSDLFQDEGLVSLPHPEAGSVLRSPISAALSSDEAYLYVVNQYGPGPVDGGNGFLSVISLDENGLFPDAPAISILNVAPAAAFFQHPQAIAVGLVGEYDEPYVFIANDNNGNADATSEHNSLIYIQESNLIEKLADQEDLIFSKMSNADLIGNSNWLDGLFYFPRKLLFGSRSDTGQRLLFILNYNFVTVMQYENIILGDGDLTTRLENNMYPIAVNSNGQIGGLIFDGQYLYVSNEFEGLDFKGGVLQSNVQLIDNDGALVEENTQYIENNYPIQDVSDLFFDEQENRLYILNIFYNSKASLLVYQYDSSENIFTPIYQKKIYGADYNVAVDTTFRKLYVQSDRNDFVAVISLDDYEDYIELSDESFEFDNPLSLAVDNTHHRLYVVNEDGPSVTVINTEDDTLVAILKNEEDVAGELDVAIPGDLLDEPEWVSVDTVHNRLYVYEGEDDDDDDFILVFDTTDDAYTFLGFIDNHSLRATSGIEGDTNDYFEDIETMIVDETRNRLYVINQENAVTVIDTTDDVFSLIQWITIDYLQSVSGVEDDNTFYFSEPERAFLDVQNQKLYVPNYEEYAVLVLDVSEEQATIDAFIRETDDFDFDNPFSIFVSPLSYAGGVAADFALRGDFIDKGLYVGTENFVIDVVSEDLEITFTEHNFKIHHLARDENEVVMIPENTQVLITNTQTEEVVSGTIIYGFITFGLHESGSPIPTVGYIECIDENDVEYELVLGEGHDVITFARTEHITHPSSQNFVRRHTDKHRDR